MVPCKGLYGGGYWVLHRRVCSNCLPGDSSHHWHGYRYDLFAINIASVMLGYIYGDVWSQDKGAPGNPNCPPRLGDPPEQCFRGLSKHQELALKVAAPIGNLVGQVLFGWLADKLGRKRMCRSCDLGNLYSMTNLLSATVCQTE